MPPIQLGPGFITLLLGFNALLLGLIALLLGLFALLLEQQGCKCAGTSLQGYLCAAAAAACAPPPALLASDSPRENKFLRARNMNRNE